MGGHLDGAKRAEAPRAVGRSPGGVGRADAHGGVQLEGVGGALVEDVRQQEEVEL